ncbi:MAG TPA: nuclear transport factor 2 family protein [Gammaproteobacteria bacterium]|jgi:hypothetical protein|nr:nuclear transport factor 2 family protein [Gammaproteobacteria bacterium]
MLYENLIQQYINGWKQNDIAMITAPLAENCIIIESHGPTYHGIQSITRWFELWQAANSSILQWNIVSFSFYAETQIAFCEWDFACISNDIKYALLGISKVQFLKEKISFIHEYRMTKAPYVWRGDRLESE